MAGGRARPTKKLKLKPEVLEEVENIEQNLENRESEMIAAVETQFENLAMSMAEGYKNDVEKFCDANPETASMLLTDYFSSINTDKKINNVAKTEDSFPAMIRVKNTGFRYAKPNELIFSVNGTPITIEQPKTFIRNFTAVTQLTEVLTPSQKRMTVEEFPEVD